MNIKKIPLAAALVGALVFLTTPAAPQAAAQTVWTDWQSLGDSVSVSFTQVPGSGGIWTWKFRNDGSQAIGYMDFYYTDNTGKNSDILPNAGPFKPGDIIGGWAAFTANSAPTIQIKSIQWANGTSAGGQTAQQQSNGSTSQTQNQPNLPPAGPTAQQQATQQRQLAAANQHLANAQAYQSASQGISNAFQAIADSISDTNGDPAAAFQADLAPYGKWMNLHGQPYWQPNQAALGSNWRPYLDGGHWVYTDAGWTWDSQYQWGWAAFHYGRWVDDPLLGWMWTPGLQWAPAWVAWRGNDTTCGWAPLPPGSGYQIGFGFSFHGVLVSVNFDFGLGPDDYCFISISDMLQPNYANCQVPAQQAAQTYKQTATVQTAFMSRGGRVFNTGVGVERVQAATHREITPVRIGDATSSRQQGANGNTLAIYRPAFAPPRIGRPAEKPGRATQLIDELLPPASSTAKTSPARATSLIDEIIPPAQTRREVTYTSPVHTASLIDEIIPGGTSGGKPAHETTRNSDDVLNRLLANGHNTTPPTRIAPAARPAGQTQPLGQQPQGQWLGQAQQVGQQPQGQAQRVGQQPQGQAQRVGQQPQGQWQGQAQQFGQQPQGQWQGQAQQFGQQPQGQWQEQQQQRQQQLEEQRQRQQEQQAERERLAEEARQRQQEQQAERERAAEEARQRQQEQQAERERLAEEARQRQQEQQAERERAAEEARQRQLEQSQKKHPNI
jgi:hypothetical protein